MSQKIRTPKQSHYIIRQKMKELGETYQSLGKKLGLRPDKLSIAVTCTGGTKRSAVQARKKVASALGLSAAEVWSSKYLQAEIARKSIDYRNAVKAYSEYSKSEAEKLEPRLKVRAMLQDRSMTLYDLAEIMGLNYKTLTNHVYGRAKSNAIREEVAKALEVNPRTIWPTLFRDMNPAPIDDVPLSAPVLWFLGFGDMTQTPGMFAPE